MKKQQRNLIKKFLGEIPINPDVGKQGDNGIPIVESMPDHDISKIYINLAEKIKNKYFKVKFKKIKNSFHSLFDNFIS